MTAIMKDDTQLFKQFQDNEGFKRWMTDTAYELVPRPVQKGDSMPSHDRGAYGKNT